MRGIKFSGFTLTELLIVLVIVGILSTLGFSQYYRTVDRAIAREAITGLRLIRAAEDIFRSQNGTYWGPNTAAGNFNGPTGAGNIALWLNLNEVNWDYDISAVNNAVIPQTFTATAARIAGGRFATCVYSMDQDDIDPTDNGSCVPAPF